MVTTTAIHSAVGVVGNVISYGLFLSPVPTFYKIYKKKAVEDFSPMPYVATLLNCMLWVFYGIPVVKRDDGTLIVTVNGGGFVLEAIYLSIFFFYAPEDRRLRVLKYLAIEFVFMAAVVVGVVAGAHSHKLRETIVGILCIIFGTLMYASPLSVMKLVITTKSVEYMPFFLSLAGFLNGVCWTAYALIIFDINVLIPNGIGACLGAIQLILYGCYYSSTPKKKSSKSSSSQVELPTLEPSSDSQTLSSSFDKFRLYLHFLE